MNKLQESRKRFYALSNRTQDGIYSFNLSINKYVYTNPAFIKIFGHPCKDIATTASVNDRIVSSDRQKLREKIVASLSDGREGDEMEYRCVDNDGNIRWMHDRWIVLRDGKGTPVAMEGIVRDVTEMKNVVSVKNFLESVLESCMDAIVVTNRDGYVTLVNRGAETLFGTNRDALVGSFIGNIIRSGPNAGHDIYQTILDRAPITNLEIEAYVADGSIVPLLISSAPLTDAENLMTGTISYMRDMTVRKQTEERIRTLSQQLIRTREVELSGIARDLHDQLAQNLYALNIQLSTFIKRLPRSGIDHTVQPQELLDSLQSIMSDVRKMVFTIHPPSLNTLGLVCTLNNLCKNISKIHGLTIVFKSAGLDALNMNFDEKIAVYRIVQEGLTNIVKHANAKNATIRIVFSYPKIIIRIEDDGDGFFVEGLAAKHNTDAGMGIWSMKERVGLLNGRMTTRSEIGRGTKILVEIPFQGDDRGVS
ncbi:MAG: PAS domain S-box protein [Thermodesulfobacteriota bacterium]